MSADEDFLARWSRRKREVADADRAAEGAAPAAESDQAGVAATPNEKPTSDSQTAAAEFDPASLPPIDSITAISDIRDFLRAGVPAELTRAALRRAWSADPAIRDFIGLAENAWDFTDPNAMPGFGPLEATDDVQQMLTRIMSRSAESTEMPQVPAADQMPRIAEFTRDSDAVTPDTAGEDEDKAVLAEPDGAPDAPIIPVSHAAAARAEDSDVATQQQHDKSDAPNKLLRRTHGRALPH